MNYEQANAVKELAPKVNKVLEKLGWKWQPKAGEWYLWTDMIKLIPMGGGMELGKLTPILEWEIIEEILEGAGRITEIAYNQQKSSKEKFIFMIGAKDGKGFYVGANESRQQAVMRAVIELGKKKTKK